MEATLYNVWLFTFALYHVLQNLNYYVYISVTVVNTQLLLVEVSDWFRLGVSNFQWEWPYSDILTDFRVQMAFGTFLVGSLHGGLKQLFVMIQIFRAVEILQVVLYFCLICWVNCTFFFSQRCYWWMLGSKYLNFNLSWKVHHVDFVRMPSNWH